MRWDAHREPAVIQGVLDRLRDNNMAAWFLPRREDVAGAVAGLLREGDRLAVGGSVTLEETGVLDLARDPRYGFVDRYAPGLTVEEEKRRLTEAFTADVFLCSANAITLNGEIYQVDGLSNRIAPLVYGPGSVVIVAGVNKLVEDVAGAVRRVRTVTAPAIVKRRGLTAPCARLGRCVAVDSRDMAEGCRCDDRRCCNFLVLGRQRIKARIKVLLVGESLGL